MRAPVKSVARWWWVVLVVPIAALLAAAASLWVVSLTERPITWDSISRWANRRALLRE